MPKRKSSQAYSKRRSSKSLPKRKKVRVTEDVKITEDVKGGAIDLFNLKNINIYPNDTLIPHPNREQLKQIIILPRIKRESVGTKFVDLTESEESIIESNFEKYRNLRTMNKTINEKYMEMLTKYVYIERLVKKRKKTFEHTNDLMKRVLNKDTSPEEKTNCKRDVFNILYNGYVELYTTLACVKKDRQEEIQRYVKCFKDEIKNN